MNKIIFGTLIFVLSIVTATPKITHAQALLGNVGGEIVGIDYCLCSSGLMLKILRAPLLVPTNVLYIPFISRLNANYNPFVVGNEVILQHTNVPVPCMKYSVTCYADGMAVGTVTSFPFAGIGTVLYSSVLQGP